MDRRVTRTKKAIRSAFLQLTLEKDMEKITIKEIAERADVDRKTVYNYYGGIVDILDEIENELVQSFEVETRVVGSQNDPREYFIMIARLIQKDMDLYELLMRSNNSTFVDKIIFFLRDWIQAVLNKAGQYSEEKIALAAEFVTSGLYSSYRYWFASDRTKSLEAFSLELCSLIMGGLPGYFLMV